jgi:hypothetical protein
MENSARDPRRLLNTLLFLAARTNHLISTRPQCVPRVLARGGQPRSVSGGASPQRAAAPLANRRRDFHCPRGPAPDPVRPSKGAPSLVLRHPAREPRPARTRMHGISSNRQVQLTTCSKEQSVSSGSGLSPSFSLSCSRRSAGLRSESHSSSHAASWTKQIHN